MGGPWECAATKGAGELMPSEPPELGSTANTTLAKEVPCTDEGCTKGECIVGMVLQQSWA